VPRSTRRATAPKSETTSAGPSPRPIRTITVTLELEGYVGWTADMQSNVPLRVLDDIDRVDIADFDVMRAALVGLVQSHTFPLKGDLNGELTSEEVWALRRAYIKALNAVTTPSKSD